MRNTLLKFFRVPLFLLLAFHSDILHAEICETCEPNFNTGENKSSVLQRCDNCAEIKIQNRADIEMETSIGAGGLISNILRKGEAVSAIVDKREPLAIKLRCLNCSRRNTEEDYIMFDRNVPLEGENALHSTPKPGTNKVDFEDIIIEGDRNYQDLGWNLGRHNYYSTTETGGVRIRPVTVCLTHTGAYDLKLNINDVVWSRTIRPHSSKIHCITRSVHESETLKSTVSGETEKEYAKVKLKCSGCSGNNILFDHYLEVGKIHEFKTTGTALPGGQVARRIGELVDLQADPPISDTYVDDQPDSEGVVNYAEERHKVIVCTKNKGAFVGKTKVGEQLWGGMYNTGNTSHCRTYLVPQSKTVVSQINKDGVTGAHKAARLEAICASCAKKILDEYALIDLKRGDQQVPRINIELGGTAVHPTARVTYGGFDNFRISGDEIENGITDGTNYKDGYSGPVRTHKFIVRKHTGAYSFRFKPGAEHVSFSRNFLSKQGGSVTFRIPEYQIKRTTNNRPYVHFEAICTISRCKNPLASRIVYLDRGDVLIDTYGTTTGHQDFHINYRQGLLPAATHAVEVVSNSAAFIFQFKLGDNELHPVPWSRNFRSGNKGKVVFKIPEEGIKQLNNIPRAKLVVKCDTCTKKILYNDYVDLDKGNIILKAKGSIAKGGPAAATVDVLYKNPRGTSYVVEAKGLSGRFSVRMRLGGHGVGWSRIFHSKQNGRTTFVVPDSAIRTIAGKPHTNITVECTSGCSKNTLLNLNVPLDRGKIYVNTGGDAYKIATNSGPFAFLSYERATEHVGHIVIRDHNGKYTFKTRLGEGNSHKWSGWYNWKKRGEETFSVNANEVRRDHSGSVRNRPMARLQMDCKQAGCRNPYDDYVYLDRGKIYIDTFGTTIKIATSNGPGVNINYELDPPEIQTKPIHVRYVTSKDIYELMFKRCDLRTKKSGWIERNYVTSAYQAGHLDRGTQDRDKLYFCYADGKHALGHLRVNPGGHTKCTFPNKSTGQVDESKEYFVFNTGRPEIFEWRDLKEVQESGGCRAVAMSAYTSAAYQDRSSPPPASRGNVLGNSVNGNMAQIACRAKHPNGNTEGLFPGSTLLFAKHPTSRVSGKIGTTLVLSTSTASSQEDDSDDNVLLTCASSVGDKTILSTRNIEILCVK